MTATPDAGDASSAVSPTAHVALESILLWECSVERGSPTDSSVGDLNATINLENSVEEGGEFQFLVKGVYEFTNALDEVMVNIAATFLLQYSNSSDKKLPAEFFDKWTPSVLMHVTPFQREFLATMTNRLGLPPFYLPVLRRSELDIQVQTKISSPS